LAPSLNPKVVSSCIIEIYESDRERERVTVRLTSLIYLHVSKKQEEPFLPTVLFQRERQRERETERKRDREKERQRER